MGGTETAPGPRLLDPRSSAAVVFGAHDWTDAGLGRAPSFLRSARGVVAYLYDPAGLGLDPDLVLDFFDSGAGAGEQLAEMRDALDTRLRDRRDAGRPVADILVYYVGHGHTDDQGHLSLLVRRSRKGMEAETGIKAPDLARVLRVAAPQQRRVVVLDCCFSEAAARDFIGMSPSLDQAVAATAAKDLGDDQPRRGTLLFCSSPVGEVSMGPPNAARTLFTGAVLDVLREGTEGEPPALSFADLRDAAYGRMVTGFGANAPRPVLHQVNAAQGDLTRTPAFPNRGRTRFETARREAEERARREAEEREAEEPLRLAEEHFQLGQRRERDGDYAEAARLYRLAAEQGHAPAQGILGRYYEEGRGGLQRNGSEAARLYRLAAEQGHAPAQADLGRLYEYGGGGLAKDLKEALRWYQRAARDGEFFARRGLALYGGTVEESLGAGIAPWPPPTPPPSPAQGTPQPAWAGGRKLLKITAVAIGGAMTAIVLGLTAGRPRPAVAPVSATQVAVPTRSPEENFRLGLQRRREGNDAEAARLYRLAADQGHAGAQAVLGFFYEQGRGGLPKDEREAARLYRIAADKGDAGAHITLGVFYRDGRGGLPKDDAEAARLFRLAADKGFAWAQTNLGVFYEQGRGGLPKDDAEAARLYRLAADRGDPWAQANLGVFYRDGRGGLPKDDAEAARLFRLAADKGLAVGRANLGVFYEQGRGGLPKDEREAARLYRLAADQGDAWAQNRLGTLHEHGLGGVAKDEREAARLYRLAADQGHAAAQARLGILHEQGLGGVAKDEREAARLYRLAADQGEPPAQTNLGVFYEQGRGGLAKDPAEAVRWYQRAARAGQAYAQERLRALGRTW